VPLSDLRGQDHAIAFLNKVLSGGRVHHAFLFSGEPGAGTQEAATAFAQALTCQVNPLGCGTCDDCERVRKGLHPDVLRLARDPASAGREIRVEPLRDLCAALQLAASAGGYKVAIIDDADQLNPSSQNALLKTLEEPPPRTVLVLTTALEDRLLPTVRSRCLRVAFGPASPGLTGDGRDPQRREELVRDMLELYQHRGTPEATVSALSFAEHFGADRDGALQTTGEVALWLRDLLRFLCTGEGGSGLLPSGAKPADLSQLASRVHPVDVLDGFDALEEAVLALQSNGAARLQLEALGLKLGKAA
jgi:DNA polymerase III subunit delta'